MGKKDFRLALDEWRQTPPIFTLQSNEKDIAMETKTECESDTTNDSECESDTTNGYDAKKSARSVRVKVVLLQSRWWPMDVSWEVSNGHWRSTEPLNDPGNHNMEACLEDTRREVSRARRAPCMVELPTTPAQWRNFIRLWVFGQPPRRPLKQTKMHENFMATNALAAPAAAS